VPDARAVNVPLSLSPPEKNIRNGIEQADLDEGDRTDGFTSAEQKELRRFGASAVAVTCL